uniref:Uncharacterized protein n=1 Tax=Candidatus Kentrum sp. LFY TaxID=2126342 RepID=A0A450V166_9GAMM|nr:MAG: hypothetical protein BECKLFY1418B_GA0070995_11203 [Candidatus Kentron sp. LFY]
MEIQTISIILAVVTAIIGTAVGGAILHIYTPWLDNAKHYFRRKPIKVSNFSGRGRDIIIFDGERRIEDKAVFWGYEVTNGKLSRSIERVTLDADLRMLHSEKDSTETKGRLTAGGPLEGNTAHITYSIETDSGDYWSGFMILNMPPAAKNISGYWMVSSPIKPGRISFGDVVLDRQN